MLSRSARRVAFPALIYIDRPNWAIWAGSREAITALTVTVLLESGRDGDDPVVISLREELR